MYSGSILKLILTKAFDLDVNTNNMFVRFLQNPPPKNIEVTLSMFINEVKQRKVNWNQMWHTKSFILFDWKQMWHMKCSHKQVIQPNIINKLIWNVWMLENYWRVLCQRTITDWFCTNLSVAEYYRLTAHDISTLFWIWYMIKANISRK